MKNCIDGITSKNSDINKYCNIKSKKKNMKEEAETSSKLPPKIIMGGGVGGSSSSPLSSTTTMAALMLKSTSASNIPNLNITSSSNQLNPPTPSKQQNDEILSTLLRMNNFDSISSIKDESLDIDLSACVTISADPSGTIGGNSLSSSDFWRVLDESAQTSQLDVSNGSVGNGLVAVVGAGSCNTSRESLQTSPSASSNGNSLPANDRNELKVVVKKEQTDFSGTFLKPSTGISFSPLKRSIKPLQAEQHIRKEKSPTRLGKQETGPPSLAPIMRIHQTFIKPQVELPKLNNNGAIVQLHNNNINNNSSKQQKELMLANTNQPPPLAALETSPTSKESAAVKPFVLPEPLYKCLDCENVIFRAPELNKHTNHRLIYKCPDCEREFDLETSLKKHLKTHRPIDARKDAWKKCPDCGKCLKLGSMWMHRKIHTENKKYGCEICGQKFVQKINLTHHQRIHTSEKPYECSECQKRFQERSHLQRHQKYHAQTRSYRCEKCGKMYKTERCLKVHNLVHLEQRPFACTVCDKSFISNSKLKQHSNIHTGERPFKCNYCPRDFTNFPNWLKHTRRRHKVDHKTGEMLENIPSYCSKKSTRTPKEKKTNEVKTSAASAAKNTNSSTPITTTANQKPIDLKKMETNELPTQLQQQQQKLLTTFSTAITTTTTSSHNTAPTTVFTTITLAKPLLTVTSTSNNQPSSLNGPPPLAKVPAKRKKKQTPNTVLTQIAKTNYVDSTSVTTAATTKSTNNFLISSASIHANLPVVTTTTNCGSGPPPLALVYNNKPINVISTTLSNTNTTNTLKTTQHQQATLQQQHQQLTPKVEKVKRERKQPMPKQVQQVPPPLIIKKEFIEPTTEISVTSQEQQQHQHQQHLRLQHTQQQQQQQQTKVSFTDLHCLSITSAEELIMEQALEMEECGLYKASLPTNVHDHHHVMSNFADTDNAISSDSMADLHFKIKEEHHDMDLKLKTEEFETIKKQSICSSLESSPFSSPASMEFAPSSTLTTANDFTTNNFYLPPFTIANNQIITTNAPITAMRIEDCRGTVATAHTYLPQLITTNVSVPDLIQINNNNQRYLKATNSTTGGGSSNGGVGVNTNPSSFINQLYLPLTVNAGPVLMKSNQALPSVDTLLFSNTKLGLFNNRNLPKQATTAQHNLS